MAKHTDNCLVLRGAGAFGARCSGNALGALRRGGGIIAGLGPVRNRGSQIGSLHGWGRFWSFSVISTWTVEAAILTVLLAGPYSSQTCRDTRAIDSLFRKKGGRQLCLLFCSKAPFPLIKSIRPFKLNLFLLPPPLLL